VIRSRTRVVLIQHLLEQTERSNTGRHALGVLENLELRVFGLKDSPLKVDDLSGAWLLWPGEPAVDLATPPPSLVVLDGSWSQARKMMQRVPELRSLRRFSLQAPEGRQSLRASPPGGMSTLESIAEALALLEGEAMAQPVREAHEALIRKQLAQRGYVGPHR
jgi:DTW domain-containing protein YfiP